MTTSRGWNDDALVIAGFGVLVCGLVCGIGTLLLARDNPGGSLTGSPLPAAVALLGAGWLAITVGVAVGQRRGPNRFGVLLLAAGFAWFVAEWNNPGAGSSLVFSAGLLFYAACPPLVAHAILAYPTGRMRSPVEAVAVAT